MMETKRPIAEVIRDAERPTSRSAKLSAQAARLMRSLNLAQQWVDAAMKSSDTGHMHERAETLYDEIEEELSRVCWALEVERTLRCVKVMNEEREERLKTKTASLEPVARASALSDSLTEAYNILASVPQELLGLGGSESSERTRYKLMGALLTAQEAAEAEHRGREDEHEL